MAIHITRRLFALTVVAAWALVAPAWAQQTESGSQWKWSNPFKACSGDCALSMYGGQSISLTPMTNIFLRHQSASTWQWDSTYLVAAAISRPALEYGKYFSVAPEFGLARRFGNADGAEGWLGLFLRWQWFPWSEWVRTSIGIGVGPSLSGNVIVDYQTGTLQNRPGVGIANFFTPELALGLPGGAVDLIVRFHHRSQIWNVIPYTTDAAQFWTVGLAFHF